MDSLIIETFAWSFGKSDFFGPLGALKKKYNKPVAVWQVGSNPQFDEFRIAAENAGLPVFEEIGRCAAFLDAVKQYYGRREKLKAGT